MPLSFLKRLLLHFRFTLAELRSNRGKAGLLAASRYFFMRAFSPFGAGKRWQRMKSTASPEVERLRASGFCELPPRSSAEVSALIALFLSGVGEKSGGRFDSLEGYFRHARAAGSQRPAGVFTSGHDVLMDLLRDRSLVALAAGYLGLPASRLIGNANMDPLIRIDGGAPSTGYDNALRFHRDVDSYRFVKMFVYLTDCRQGDGHHEIYLGSHLHHPVLLGPIQRYQPSEIERLIPSARLHRVEGSAGYMFAEDTFAFHRGTVPTGKDRLICNLQYMDDELAAFNGPSYRVV